MPDQTAPRTRTTDPAYARITVYAAPAGHDGTRFADLANGDYFKSAPLFSSVWWKSEVWAHSVRTPSLSLVMHPDQPVERCARDGAPLDAEVTP